ncbi:hypothetical protein ACWGJX_45580 [Streptomyces sp. NPDC054775]
MAVLAALGWSAWWLTIGRVRVAPGTGFPSDPAEVPGPAGGYRNAPVSSPSPDLSLPVVPGLPGDAGLLVVDFGALAAAVEAARIAAGVARRAAADVQAAVQRSGGAPWGDDPGLGQAFGGVFAGPRGALAQTVEELPAVLDGLADALDVTRRGFVRAEDEALDAAVGLKRSMDVKAS